MSTQKENRLSEFIKTYGTEIMIGMIVFAILELIILIPCLNSACDDTLTTITKNGEVVKQFSGTITSENISGIKKTLGINKEKSLEQLGYEVRFDDDYIESKIKTTFRTKAIYDHIPTDEEIKKFKIDNGIIQGSLKTNGYSIETNKIGRTEILKNGKVLYAVKGKLSEDDVDEFKKAMNITNNQTFEENGFIVTVTKTENFFPVRGWITLASGIPLAIILLFTIALKIFAELLVGKQSKEESERNPEFQKPKVENFDGLIDRLSGYNTVVIASILLFTIIASWFVPNFISEITDKTINFIVKFNWVFLLILASVTFIAIMHLYTRYRCKIEVIRQQADIQKHWQELEFQKSAETITLLPEHTK